MRCQASGHTDTRACESRVVFYYGRIRNTSARSAAFGTAALTRSQLYNTKIPSYQTLSLMEDLNATLKVLLKLSRPYRNVQKLIMMALGPNHLI